MIFKRGQIVLVDLGIENKIKGEQRGVRPCVIIQNDTGNKFSPSLIVAPLTKQNKRYMPTHVKLDHNSYKLVEGSRVLCEQITTVSKKKVKESIDELDNIDINRINKALAISLAI